MNQLHYILAAIDLFLGLGNLIFIAVIFSFLNIYCNSNNKENLQLSTEIGGYISVGNFFP